MASNKFSKESVEWKIFMDIWAYAQEFAIPEDNETYWNNAIAKAEDLGKKYENFDGNLARQMAMAWMNHFEKVQKEVKNGST